jgi:hypothetical protein
MKSTIVLSILLILASVFKSTAQEMEYEKIFNDEIIMHITSGIIATKDNGYIITGIESLDLYSTKNIITKLDNNFNILWKKEIELGQISPFDNIYEHNLNEYTLIRKYFSGLFFYIFDNHGNMIYDTNDTNDTNEQASYYSSNIIYCNNEYIFLSHTYNTESENILKLFKYDSLGRFKSIVIIDTIPSESEMRHYGSVNISNASDNGFIIAGSESYTVNKQGELFLLRVDSSGKKIWRKKYKKEVLQYPKKILFNSDNHIIVIGNYKHNDLSVERPLFISKYDDNGNEIWETKLLNNPKIKSASSVIETANNDYILTGLVVRDYASKNFYDFYLAKLSNDGNLEWEKQWHSDSTSKLSEIIEIDKDRYVVYGRTSDDIVNAKTRVYLASIIDRSSLVEQNLNSFVYSLHPNPTTSQITLSLADEFISSPEIDIIDYLGNVKRCTTSSRWSPSDKSITINTTSLYPGVYFLRVRSGDRVEVRKFVVI